jgi:hypothetical protein
MRYGDLQMQKTRAALAAALTGIAIMAVGFVGNALFGSLGPRIAHGLALLIVFGNAIGFYGCLLLARAKGRPWYFGLLGLLSVIGLPILWFVVPAVPPTTR